MHPAIQFQEPRGLRWQCVPGLSESPSSGLGILKCTALCATKAPLCWWHRAPGLGRCAGLDFWLTMRKLMHFLSGSDLGILDTGRGQVGGRMGRAADVSRNGEMSAEEECTATKIQSEGCGREQGMERVAPG